MTTFRNDNKVKQFIMITQEPSNKGLKQDEFYLLDIISQYMVAKFKPKC